MDEARNAFLPGPAFTGDQDGGVDFGHPPRQIQRPQHRWTRRDKTGRHRGVDLSQGATGLELPFSLLERVGQLRQRRIQTGLLVERQVRGEFRTPLLF